MAVLVCKEVHWERDEEGKGSETEDFSKRGNTDTTGVLTMKNLDLKKEYVCSRNVEPMSKLIEILVKILSAPSFLTQNLTLF